MHSAVECMTVCDLDPVILLLQNVKMQNLLHAQLMKKCQMKIKLLLEICKRNYHNNANYFRKEKKKKKR